MPQITILRHSLAVANEQGILMGAKLDSPLSEKGIELARSKGASLKAAGFMPDKIYTSKLIRAKQTAEIMLQELGAAITITELETLNERDFGEYDNKPYKYILADLEKYGDNLPSVEPAHEFIARVTSAWEQIKREATGITLVVSHSNPAMVMQTLAFYPEKTAKFWELGDPPYCEGFVYNF